VSGTISLAAMVEMIQHKPWRALLPDEAHPELQALIAQRASSSSTEGAPAPAPAPAAAAAVAPCVQSSSIKLAAGGASHKYAPEQSVAQRGNPRVVIPEDATPPLGGRGAPLQVGRMASSTTRAAACSVASSSKGSIQPPAAGNSRGDSRGDGVSASVCASVPAAAVAGGGSEQQGLQDKKEAAAQARVAALEAEMERMKAETQAVLRIDAERLKSMEEALRASNTASASAAASAASMTSVALSTEGSSAARFDQAKADELLRVLSDMLCQGSLTPEQVRQVDSLAQKDDPLVLGAFDQFRQTQDVEFFLRRVLLILRCS